MAWDISTLLYFKVLFSYKSNKNIFDFNWSMGKVSWRSKVKSGSKVKILDLTPKKVPYLYQLFNKIVPIASISFLIVILKLV